MKLVKIAGIDPSNEGTERKSSCCSICRKPECFSEVCCKQENKCCDDRFFVSSIGNLEFSGTPNQNEPAVSSIAGRLNFVIYHLQEDISSVPDLENNNLFMKSLLNRSDLRRNGLVREIIIQPGFTIVLNDNSVPSSYPANVTYEVPGYLNNLMRPQSKIQKDLTFADFDWQSFNIPEDFIEFIRNFQITVTTRGKIIFSFEVITGLPDELTFVSRNKVVIRYSY